MRLSLSDLTISTPWPLGDVFLTLTSWAPVRISVNVYESWYEDQRIGRMSWRRDPLSGELVNSSSIFGLFKA